VAAPPVITQPKDSAAVQYNHLSSAAQQCLPLKIFVTRRILDIQRQEQW